MLNVGEERAERKKKGKEYCAARKVRRDSEEREVFFYDATAVKIILPCWWINET
jgi:hypothetical protein